MKRTRIVFLRHADTEKNPNLNAALWELSNKGTKQAEDITNLSIMNEVDIVYVSEEKKTFLTVLPLANKLKQEPVALSEFNEVKRGDKFLTKEEFEAEKIKQLEDLAYPAFGGESGNEALARFKQGIDSALRENVGKTILVVTHGTILNIYFADLLDMYNALPERWKKTGFCSYGVIEEGKIIKDIIS